MVDMNEPGPASAAGTAQIRLSGVAVVQGEPQDADDAPHAELGALISRERRRQAEALAGAPIPEAGTGGRVNCVLCFGVGGRPEETAG
ncbi:hypothetical protein [Longimicrobium terrae]|uniref:Uncharacterized protein n=1 Tax=Longimicrobium terrae TaxID=1639882 RepID=A0A841GK36_9BACT|nr:hypothetical protein [Longimicrobium terrae]MBB4634029.1 hypothetical protein [Longimicrobium terrae]MBB6069081.1 hypothetical protein [Longimicrobium terrae]NNC28256.1 hypothetical protein [Longimicrobium terrae]